MLLIAIFVSAPIVSLSQTATDNSLILPLLPKCALMFNIWKQAWRNEDTASTDHEASVNLETLSGASGDQPLAESACPAVSVLPQTVSCRAQLLNQPSTFFTSKKHSRAVQRPSDPVDVADTRPTKKARKETHADAPKKDSLANYLPELPAKSIVKPPVVGEEKPSHLSLSYVDEISERAQRINSKAWLTVNTLVNYDLNISFGRPGYDKL
jgi:hypothetical protein